MNDLVILRKIHDSIPAICQHCNVPINQCNKLRATNKCPEMKQKWKDKLNAQ